MRFCGKSAYIFHMFTCMQNVAALVWTCFVDVPCALSASRLANSFCESSCKCANISCGPRLGKNSLWPRWFRFWIRTHQWRTYSLTIISKFYAINLGNKHVFQISLEFAKRSFPSCAVFMKCVDPLKRVSLKITNDSRQIVLSAFDFFKSRPFRDFNVLHVRTQSKHEFDNLAGLLVAVDLSIAAWPTHLVSAHK